MAKLLTFTAALVMFTPAAFAALTLAAKIVA